jgi:hypothetical protein
MDKKLFKELKIGSKIDIECKEGHSSNLVVSHEGNKIDHITSLQIDAQVNENVKASIGLISPVVSLKDVEICKIVDSNPKITKVQKLIGEYYMAMSNTKKALAHDYLMAIELVINGY